jgi:hypothetical protein
MAQSRPSPGQAGQGCQLTPYRPILNILRKVIRTTAIPAPLLSHMRGHTCSNERESPTSATNARIANCDSEKLRQRPKPPATRDCSMQTTLTAVGETYFGGNLQVAAFSIRACERSVYPANAPVSLPRCASSNETESRNLAGCYSCFAWQ